eukprot:1332909-Amorphochlora_amoeboformis.AAC.2
MGGLQDRSRSQHALVIWHHSFRPFHANRKTVLTVGLHFMPTVNLSALSDCLHAHQHGEISGKKYVADTSVFHTTTNTCICLTHVSQRCHWSSSDTARRSKFNLIPTPMLILTKSKPIPFKPRIYP